MGIVKIKQLIRSHVWFPGIDRDVENLIKTCPKCQINTNTTKFEPLNHSATAKSEWYVRTVHEEFGKSHEKRFDKSN